MLKRFALIGDPVAHSFSPLIHEAGYRALGIEAEFVKHQVTNLVTDWDEVSYYDGLAVTMPWKQSIIGFCDIVEPLARAVGAVNTVISTGGLHTGLNTDVYGIAQAILTKSKSQDFRHMVIIGGRASASSALAASAEFGRPNVTVIARTLSGPGTVSQASSRLGMQITPLPWRMAEAARRALESADLVVSTVPKGVADQLCHNLRPRSDAFLLEAAYAKTPSKLEECFAQAGATVIDGTEMLLFQAFQQFTLMTGKSCPEAEMRAALEAVRPVS